MDNIPVTDLVNTLQDDSTNLMETYQKLESQWAEKNEYLNNLKMGRFDDTAIKLLDEMVALELHIKDNESQIQEIQNKLQVFEDDHTFIKKYNEKNIDQESFYFSAFETATGFKNSFLEYKKNAEEIKTLSPLVENLKKQVEEKEKIRDYLRSCCRNETKFHQFVKEYTKFHPEQKFSKWSELKWVFTGRFIIMGFPEEAYEHYKKILDDHIERASTSYWNVKKEFEQKNSIYERLKETHDAMTNHAGFMRKFSAKKNTKGVVVFTPTDYIGGFRNKAMSYKKLKDQKAFHQENCATALQIIRNIENNLHIRQSEIEVLYASLIEEMTTKVEQLASQKRTAFKKWSENQSLENHPDRLPKNLFKL